MSADPVTLAAIGTIIGAGATAGSALGIFGGGDKQAPAAPVTAAPTVMPEPDDEAAKKAKLREAQALTARRGRQSTVLSDSVTSDPLGA